MQACRCSSNKPTAECCGPFLSNDDYPATAEQLMRSRYSAYVTGNIDFLRYSWHPATCPANLALNPEQKWLGLKIVFSRGNADDSEGVVQFVARYKIAGRGHRLEETSRFTRYAGRWVYLGGTIA